MRGLLFLFRFRSLVRLVGRLMMDRRVPLRIKLILPAALVYLVSPLDIIPDIVPALGRIDDILVIFISVVLFLALSPREVVMEHLGIGGANSSPPESSSETDDNVVEGKYRVIEDGKEPGH